jgi:hypothetical protein
LYVEQKNLIGQIDMPALAYQYAWIILACHEKCGNHQNKEHYLIRSSRPWSRCFISLVLQISIWFEHPLGTGYWWRIIWEFNWRSSDIYIGGSSYKRV